MTALHFNGLGLHHSNLGQGLQLHLRHGLARFFSPLRVVLELKVWMPKVRQQHDPLTWVCLMIARLIIYHFMLERVVKH